MKNKKNLIKYENLSTEKRVEDLKNKWNRFVSSNIDYIKKQALIQNGESLEKINELINNHIVDYESVMQEINNYKYIMSEIDSNEDKEKYYNIYNYIGYIKVKTVLYEIDVYSKIIDEEDINNLIGFDNLKNLDNISHLKEKKILDELNKLDVILKLNLDIIKIFVDYFLNKGKHSMEEYFKLNKRRNKELNTNYICYGTLAVFSEFKPNIDYNVDDLINRNITEITGNNLNNEQNKNIRLKMKSLFPKYKKEIEYITNIKTIDIYEDKTLRLFHLNDQNVFEYFESMNFVKLVERNVKLGNESLVYIHNDYGNYNFIFELDLGNVKIKNFRVRFLNLKDLIIETRAKLYGIDIQNLTEFKDLKLTLTEEKFKCENNDLDKHIENILYYQIQDFYKNSVFILKRYHNKEFKQLFKLNNLIISSGVNNTKHLASRLDFRIIKFLSTIYDNNSKEHEIINNSFSNSKFKITLGEKNTLKLFNVLENYNEIKSYYGKIKMENNKIIISPLFNEDDDDAGEKDNKNEN